MRITAGTYRSRVLHSPDDLSIRPTSDKVRQAVFNMLGQDISDAKVLDLCCGTGAMGFEALSRGAQHVTFIDTNVKLARRNADTLKIQSDKASFIQGTAETAPWPDVDIVFCDPPYALSENIDWLKTVMKPVKPCTLVLEVAKANTVPADLFTNTPKHKVYGKTAVYIGQIAPKA